MLQCVFHARANSEYLVSVNTVAAVTLCDGVDCYVLKGVELVKRQAGEKE
jgi:hypothetical protein